MNSILPISFDENETGFKFPDRCVYCRASARGASGTLEIRNLGTERSRVASMLLGPWSKMFAESLQVHSVVAPCHFYCRLKNAVRRMVFWVVLLPLLIAAGWLCFEVFDGNVIAIFLANVLVGVAIGVLWFIYLEWHHPIQFDAYCKDNRLYFGFRNELDLFEFASLNRDRYDEQTKDEINFYTQQVAARSDVPQIDADGTLG